MLVGFIDVVVPKVVDSIDVGRSIEVVGIRSLSVRDRVLV